MVEWGSFLETQQFWLFCDAVMVDTSVTNQVSSESQSHCNFTSTSLICGQPHSRH